MPRTEFLQNGLHVMAKPIGPICNLDCEYCYYLHKEELYPGGESWRMPEETLESFIRQYIDAQPAGVPEITFAWQGGEPTLLGVEFFRRVVEIQKRFAPARAKVVNTLQTNSVLLDDDWCRLFVEEEFLIGLSIDGPAELHDRYRYDKKGRPTFRAVLDALKLLKKHNVEFNALVVVNRENGNHGKRVYTYLRDNGVKFLQFIPIVERRGVGVHAEDDLPLADDNPPRLGKGGPGGVDTNGDTPTDSGATPPNPPLVRGGMYDRLVSSRSVLPEQFGSFLIEVFNEWIKRDVGKVFVQIFDQALSAWVGIEPSLCVFRKQCGRALAIEHNGDLYSCDHYVEPEYKLGNINDLPIVELASSDRQIAFGEAKESTLPQYCRDCEVRFACNGECPKNRFIETPDGEAGLNYLCAGYRKFFNHIDPVMKLMAEEVKANRPAANVMQRLRVGQAFQPDTKRREATIAQTAPRQAGKPDLRSPGRNDPCPCGSGRKFKKCCGRN